jgi:uncharacterized membrane protein YqhA
LIHLTFVISALAIAYTETLLAKAKSH